MKHATKSHSSSAEDPLSSLKQLNKSIVLVGLMGAGKSTVGRRLAKALHTDFFDSDTEIEQAAGMPISEIFSVYGEPAFRDLEIKTIRNLIGPPVKVIATGGGAFIQPAIRELLLGQSLTIWLKADLDVLLERVSRRSHRPLLEQGDKRNILQNLMEVRYPLYAEATLTVDSNDDSHEAVLEKILDAIKSYLAHPSGVTGNASHADASHAHTV
jgi:shikimate kinase